MKKQSKYLLKTFHKSILADTVTPVNIYLKIRDIYPNSILLESSDYHTSENSFSYICCDPIATFKVKNEKIYTGYPDQSHAVKSVRAKKNVIDELDKFMKCFKTDVLKKFDFVYNGLFGYIGYDAVKYFENISLTNKADATSSIPLICYSVFRYVIAINHYNNELHIFDHQYKSGKEKLASGISNIESLINNKRFQGYTFTSQGKETSNYNNKDFLKVLKKAKDHVQRGDVFQIVISRKFNKNFKGDDFNVYRSLRSINPSPYLYYFDYGSFKIFGSSPEAQLVINGNKASIHPIAGTFKRTGHDEKDAQLARELQEDPKENAEHVMLVDLARNDLSRNGTNVTVEKYREIQYYSHVIHLVSEVSSKLGKNGKRLKLIADTFPAGTLSGAPKHRAMQLIDKYENSCRGFYGGCIGILNFNGDFNHAIIIRSFLSKDNVLYFQAGAGIVDRSKIKNELDEVNNKLQALRSAIEMAEKI